METIYEVYKFYTFHRWSSSTENHLIILINTDITACCYRLINIKIITITKLLIIFIILLD